MKSNLYNELQRRIISRQIVKDAKTLDNFDKFCLVSACVCMVFVAAGFGFLLIANLTVIFV